MLQVFKKNQKGFTLIELLVVIAIIGVLSTIVLVSLNTAREKARDVRRVSDMRQVALALEMYYDDNTSTGYPGTAGADSWAVMETAIEGGGYIASVPTDPGTGTYQYYVATDNQRYVLNATLEDDNNAALRDDLDGTILGCNCADTAGAPEYCIQP
ncbi:prepilin-type N-terminal cleavage/methylation domain-containing protein [Patescibacteria group bacterium]|nr:prepilin-type N-terminal cleavage/methylation domain-containing protein [Patescibacteria group bacterium]